MPRQNRDDRQFDLFVPYLSDIPLRDQRDTMERPFFSLSKRKRLKPINYTSPDGSVWVRVQPHQDFGMATIWDADVLIWAASKITDEIVRRGLNDLPGPTIRFHPYDLLKSIRRHTGGDQYARLKEALDRLKFTAIKTNIRSEGRKKESAFNWLESWTDDVDQASGESRGMTITLSSWLYNGIIDQRQVLAIHPDYFILTGGLERWLYRVARKHAGGNGKMGFTISVTTLFEKSGSEDLSRRFKASLREVVQADKLPEFHLEWIDKTESGESAVHMIRRSCLAANHPAFTFSQPRSRTRPRRQ